jgi:uncharacterized metal-binding protein
MADGAEHARVSKILNSVIIPASIIGGFFIDPSLYGLAVGAVVGTLVTPDLDHHQLTTFDEHRIWSVWAPFGFVWQVYWYPYGLTHKHRGGSHTWPWGTLVRFMYFLWGPIFLWFTWLGFDWSYVLFWLFIFTGQSMQDLLHYYKDDLI